jgi:hypothetical protein
MSHLSIKELMTHYTSTDKHASGISALRRNHEKALTINLIG